METNSSLTARIAALLAIASALLALACALSGCQGGQDGPKVYVQPVRAVNAAGGFSTNAYNGVVESQKTEGVQLESGRVVKEVLVAEGDAVAKDDPLFTYDTAAGELEVQKGELDIERLDTDIKNSNDSIAELQKELDKASGGDAAQLSAQILQLQADVAQAEYDRRAKQAELERLRASVADPTVRAPIAGTVQHVGDASGAASGGDYGYTDGGAGGENAFITILASGDLRVRGKVSEQNIYMLGQGERVIVRSRVFADQAWGGQIASIETSPSQDSNRVYYDSGSGEGASNYNFYVDLDDTAGLMLGQHVTIEMDWGQAAPREGIWLDEGWIATAEDGSSFVWACSAEGAPLEQRSVMVGERDEDLGIVEVTAGLDLSDYIAWPDESCTRGAATTTDITETFDEEEFEDEWDEALDGESWDEDAMTDDGMWEEPLGEDVWEEDQAWEGEASEEMLADAEAEAMEASDQGLSPDEYEKLLADAPAEGGASGDVDVVFPDKAA